MPSPYVWKKQTKIHTFCDMVKCTLCHKHIIQNNKVQYQNIFAIHIEKHQWTNRKKLDLCVITSALKSVMLSPEHLQKDLDGCTFSKVKTLKLLIFILLLFLTNYAQKSVSQVCLCKFHFRA